MAADEPTAGELMRRMDAVSRQLETLAKQLAEDRRDFASTYVRYDVYEARHLSLDRRVTILETDAEAREQTADATRRQFVLMLLSIAIPAVGALLLSMFLFLGRGVT